RMVGDLVASYDPGFGFTTLVDDGLLMWISHLVHHEVNLYWGSSIWASSKPELFAAGLLPERIPGEVFSRLTLGGYELASRTTVTRGTGYLELYAPLRIPGGPAEQERLFLSVPLLAQEEEVARELAALRRRVVLASAALFALLVAVGVALARRFSQPLEELVEGTRRIAAGAESLDMAPSELELAALVRAVDDMARRIAESRSRLVREKEVVDRMVDSITSGVVSLDHERRVLMHNRVAAELLGVRVGEELDEVLARSPRLAPVARELAGAGHRPHRTTVRLHTGDGAEEREWTLVWVPVPGAGEPAALLVVEDATDVLRSQRLQAWAEMARMIAHEIKNPLTPLRLSTEHLREVYRAAGGEGRRELDEVFERCTANILRQVEELRDIASEFSAFSSIPRIDPRPGDPVEPLKDLVEAYREATAAGVQVRLESESAPPTARFDARLLGRAVRNLLENAVRASPPGGRVVLRVTPEDGCLAIAVRDSGPGVPAELLGRIFDPYFSTHDTGTGLGLPIARRIAEEHGGTITARNRPGGGLEVTIRIPL
ncbi:MAG: sensor histidine kinase, partial [bacterium]